MPTGVYVRTPEYRAKMSAAGHRRWGDPVSRFWSHVERGRDCWLWTGACDGGYSYGSIYYKGRRQKAHRVSWQLANGPIPPGMHVLHRCDNPPCVNPAHLFLGNQADNMRDMARKGRAVGGPGAKHGEAHHMAKLSDAQVDEIRALRRLGWTQHRIAAEFGVTQGNISMILSGRRRAGG